MTVKSFTFFLASAVEPLAVRRSRTFATTRNRIDDFDDTVFADLLSLVEELQRPEPSFDDALLRDLVRDRTGEIVSKKGTAFLVSEAQYRSMAETVYLIRSPRMRSDCSRASRRLPRAMHPSGRPSSNEGYVHRRRLGQLLLVER